MIIQRDSKFPTEVTGPILAKIFLLYGDSAFTKVRLSQPEFTQVINEADGYITFKYHEDSKLTGFQVGGYPIDFVLDIHQ